MSGAVWCFSCCTVSPAPAEGTQHHHSKSYLVDRFHNCSWMHIIMRMSRRKGSGYMWKIYLSSKTFWCGGWGSTAFRVTLCCAFDVVTQWHLLKTLKKWSILCHFKKHVQIICFQALHCWYVWCPWHQLWTVMAKLTSKFDLYCIKAWWHCVRMTSPLQEIGSIVCVQCYSRSFSTYVISYFDYSLIALRH